jgi:hypothetical protein
MYRAFRLFSASLALAAVVEALAASLMEGLIDYFCVIVVAEEAGLKAFFVMQGQTAEST